MELTRRRFLQGVGGCATAALLSGAVDLSRRPASAESFPGNPDLYGMLTDTTMCVGCRVCELACAQANGLPEPDIADRSVFQAARRPHADAFTVVNGYQPAGSGQTVYRKIQCMHCDEAACVSACPVGALKKMKQGPVTYNRDVCIGCRYCMAACPFNMPAFEWNSLKPFIRKCQMCYVNLVAQGKPPACAAACPTKATIFGRRGDLLALAHKRISDNSGKYAGQVYSETEAGGTGWLYLSAVPFEQLAPPVNLGSTPLPEYTRPWLAAVPAVLILWPALLMGVHAMLNRRDRPGGEAAPSQKARPIQ